MWIPVPVIEANRGFLSFNRYMVECELLHYRFDSIQSVGFNRYMVECECENGLNATVEKIKF